ncbi:hypothetical protein IZY60_14810, partial [Lutibacter sp. B2]|nr:hypothetical protein [Lutibacter sp. B2]
MKKKMCTIITSILLVFIIIASNAYAENNKKVVLFVTNTMNYSDLTHMTSVKKLIDTGAIGLMNTRTAGKSDMYKSCVTIGSGTRAEASYNTIKSFAIDDKIKGIYKRRTGIELDKSGIVNIDMARLINLNIEGEYGAVSGEIGKTLHDQGKKTAVIGNGDVEDSYLRLGSLIAMDENGYIDDGYIESDILIDDNDYPFGMKTNYKFLVSKFKDLYNKNDFIVIDIEDMARLEKYKVNLSEKMYERMNEQMIKDIDLFISDCLKEVNLENTRLILLNPYAKTTDIKNGNILTPLIMVGDGIQRGILTSATTRREGIIGNVDVAPSIIEYFGGPPKKMSGHPLEIIENNDNLNYLTKLNNKTIAVSEQRYPVLSGFAIFEIFASIIALIMILMKKKINASIFYFFTNILLSTMVVPFVLLIIPLFGTRNLFVTYT